MDWVIAEYSKKEVMRAGELLISPECTDEQRAAAMDVLSNWRAAHAYPMHALLMYLRTKATHVDDSSVVVQRLKRTPSILGKLSRFPSMKLHRMQDISGCRAIVSSVRDVEKLEKLLVSSRSRHKLHKVDNYIHEPKDTGYRGIHIVYKYNGSKLAYEDYFVELQLRSKVQHAWATAVEIVDTFTNQALKASQGKKEWLDFFRYVSAEFSRLERRPVGQHIGGVDTASEVARLAKKLNVLHRLNAFTVTAAHITEVTTEKSNKTDYFLLELSSNPQLVTVTRYSSSEFDRATKDYLDKEKKSKSDSSYDVVLVAAGSLHALRSAYPNYFADSKAFLTYLRRVMPD